jgi:Domain of unknown function (DUF4234)
MHAVGNAGPEFAAGFRDAPPGGHAPWPHCSGPLWPIYVAIPPTSPNVVAPLDSVPAGAQDAAGDDHHGTDAQVSGDPQPRSDHAQRRYGDVTWRLFRSSRHEERIDAASREPHERRSVTSSPRWRWYRSRFGPTTLVAVILIAIAALAPKEAWYEQATPFLGSRLTRVARPWPGGTSLAAVVDSPPLAVHESVVVADGTPLVGERLLRYADSHEAQRAVEDVLQSNGAGDASTVHGFARFRTGCATACRPVSVGRDEEVVVVIAPLDSAMAEGSRRAERSYAQVVDAYADLYEGASWRLVSGPVDYALILVAVALSYLPWLVWHVWVTRRAQRTRHVHRDGATPAYVVDLCDASGAARVRAHKLLVLGLAIFALTSALVAALPEGLGLWLMLLAGPIWWLVVRHGNAGRPRVAPRPGPSALEHASLARSLRIRVDIVAAHAAAVSAVTCAWLTGAMVILLVGIFARAVVEEGVIGLMLVMLGAIVAAFGNVAPVLSRLSRRLRVAAASREREHGRRPSVLYLRTFDDDHRLLAAGGPQARGATEFLSFRARVPYEEVVVRELDRYGAVQAVAEPGRPRLVPALGAARMRLSDEEWQAGVAARLHEAALILIAVGTTKGLVWELEETTRQGLLDRVVLIVPPDDDAAVQSRWQAAVEAISRAGGPAIGAVEPADVLLARLDGDGLRQLFVADRRDEHAYVEALDQAIVIAPDHAVGGRQTVGAVRERGATDLGPPGSVRGVGMTLLLFLVTGGLYSLYWAFKTHEELKRHTGSGLGGELGLALWLLGFGTSGFVIPAEVARMYRSAGRRPEVTVWTGLWLVPGVFFFLFPALVWFVRVQRALNTYWTQIASPPVPPRLDRVLVLPPPPSPRGW